MKSIRTKITTCLILTVIIGLVASGASGILLNYNNTMSTVERMMGQTAVLAAERVQQELEVYKNVVMEVGCIPQLSDSEVSVEDKQVIIDERVSMHDFQRGNIVGADGISIFDGNDYSDREYVRQAMEGNVYVSEPLISKVTGELSIMVAAPLYSQGNYGKSVAGVVYFVPRETFLNDIVSAIQVGENSRAYMINKSGGTIADVTLDTITVQNIEEEAKSDPALKELAAIHSEMRQGKNGFGSYVNGEDKMFAAYAPVPGTDGWSIAVTAPQLNYLASTRDAMVINIAVIAASILISVIVALILATNIGRPMKACVKRMQLLVEGDLETPMPKITSKDETGVLVRTTQSLVEGLRIVINDISYLLNEMANQNLDVHTEHEEVYVGSFQDILVSMRNMRLELSGAMRQVNHSAQEVANASSQLSSSAQTLSQGTAEQAARISVISEEVKDTADGALDVRSQTHQTGEEVFLCNQKMQTLVEAMEKIQASSEEIEKILKTIDDIAFQTNILALNAAVEAARAGSAGKGFAVVAEEVRNLAGKSAQAAKNTSELIGNSTDAVHIGTGIAQNTADVLLGVVNSIQTVVEAIDHIAVISGEQSESVERVSEGINQISVVVQSNSATAEEGAAASEQLSAEAASLKELVGQFTLSSE